MIDSFHRFLKMCSKHSIITEKRAFKLYLFQFFTVINNYKKRIIKEKPVYPWQLNQWATVSIQQKVLTSLNSAPKSTLQLPMAAVGGRNKVAERRLPRKVVEWPSLEGFKRCVSVALGNMVQWWAWKFWVISWTQWT